MAEHSSGHGAQDLSSHTHAYEGFLKGSIVLALCCGLILLALINVGFGHSHEIFKAFAGLIVGFLGVLIDVRSGGKWMLSVGILLIFGIITAMNVT
jgi:hypothetical protein